MPRASLTFDEFVRRANIAHDNRYDYSVTQLTNQHANVTVICPVHGPFTVSASNHIKNYQRTNVNYSPSGCGACGRESTINRNRAGADSKEQFVHKATNVHNFKYTYPGGYSGQNHQVEINCASHGSFYQLASNHLRGTGCPRCKNSRGATLVAKCLTRMGIEYVQEKTFDDCRGDTSALRFDFWIPSHNALIEYDGEHHFYPIRFRGLSTAAAEKLHQRVLRYDEIKTQYASDKQMVLIRIPYHSKDQINTILKLHLHEG